jgi:hypothetical protein
MATMVLLLLSWLEVAGAGRVGAGDFEGVDVAIAADGEAGAADGLGLT